MMKDDSNGAGMPPPDYPGSMSNGGKATYCMAEFVDNGRAHRTFLIFLLILLTLSYLNFFKILNGNGLGSTGGTLRSGPR